MASPVAADAASEIRRELKKLGERRTKAERAEGALTTDITKALKRAHGLLSMSEAADLLGMHRTTVYRVYLDD